MPENKTKFLCSINQIIESDLKSSLDYKDIIDDFTRMKSR